MLTSPVVWTKYFVVSCCVCVSVAEPQSTVTPTWTDADLWAPSFRTPLLSPGVTRSPRRPATRMLTGRHTSHWRRDFVWHDSDKRPTTFITDKAKTLRSGDSAKCFLSLVLEDGEDTQTHTHTHTHTQGQSLLKTIFSLRSESVFFLAHTCINRVIEHHRLHLYNHGNTK